MVSRTQPALQLKRINSGFGLRRESWLQDYIATPMRPVMWRVYLRDDAVTRKHEEMFQSWRGIVDFAYRRPYGQIQHPKWMRQAYAEKKRFDLDAETPTEKLYLGFTANFLWSHWSRRGTSIPPVQVLEAALLQARTPKDLGYATKMLRAYRQYFNVHLEHNIFTAYMNASLTAGCSDCALYALNQARWLGFSTVREIDRQFLLGKVEEHPSETHPETGEKWSYQRDVADVIKKLETEGNPHLEPIAEVADFSPFAKFWKTHETEQGWWVYPWDKDPSTNVINHFWRHPHNVDPRHGTAYTEWTAYGTPLATDAYGVPTDLIGDEAVRAMAGDAADGEVDELGSE
ncbi:hypothetical protein DIPPA_25715 [Diplonema papillatum]|nr:hypothetical protein DIPPA_25715 [Diplonema papillatum]